MGCGASKAVQVAETEITTDPKPVTPDQSGGNVEGRIRASTSHQSSTANDPSGELSSASPLCSMATSQENRNSLLIDKTVSSASRDSAIGSQLNTHASIGENSEMESTAEQRINHEVAARSSNEKFTVFEIDMGDRGSVEPIAPPPRRLEKLDGAPKVTAESLAEKQRGVQERKEQELAKRAQHTRLSKKERLRKEIMEARDLEIAENESSKDSNTAVIKPMDDHLRDFVDEVVEMEVDQTYNLDPPVIDDWAKDEHTLSTARECATSGNTSMQNHKGDSDEVFSNWETTTHEPH